MARKHRAEQWAEHRRQRDEAERRQRVMVITEFDAGDPEVTLHALADEILKYRRAVRLLARAIGWADAGALFAIVSPGPYWRPTRMIDGTPEMPDVAPPSRPRASARSRASGGCGCHSLAKDQQQQPQALPNTDHAKAA
jgi:hypothetical protein